MEAGSRLRVAETSSRLVGHGIAAIDPKVMEQLGLSAGDVIEITGKGKKSHAVLWTGYPEDYGRGLIRIDGYTRNNIGVGIDDTVAIAQAAGQGGAGGRPGPDRAAQHAGTGGIPS